MAEGSEQESVPTPRWQHSTPAVPSLQTGLGWWVGAAPLGSALPLML